MAANAETMFSVREKPWHGLGTIVAEVPDSQAALTLAGLDWTVIQKDILTVPIRGFKANVRDSDGSGAIKVAMTPIRVVCQNTLNMALAPAKRS